MALDGQLLIISKEDDPPGSGMFTAIAAMIAKELTLTRSQVEATTSDDAHDRVLNTKASIRSMSVSGNGLFIGSTEQDELITLWNSADPVVALEIEDGSGKKYAGSFQLTDFGQGGEVDGNLTFSLSFESTGAITYS